jgi:hypothetical protein
MVAWGIERLISDAYERDPAGWQNLTSINIRRVKNPASTITNNVGGDEQCRSGAGCCSSRSAAQRDWKIKVFTLAASHSSAW